MFTYQVRPRVLRISGDRKPDFPANVEVSLYFQPLQPFGKASGGGLAHSAPDPDLLKQFNTMKKMMEKLGQIGGKGRGL